MRGLAKTPENGKLGERDGIKVKGGGRSFRGARPWRGDSKNGEKAEPRNLGNYAESHWGDSLPKEGNKRIRLKSLGEKKPANKSQKTPVSGWAARALLKGRV